MLAAFGEQDDSHHAFATMSETLADGRVFRRYVGGQGFSGEWDVTWHANVGMWSLLDPGDDLNRFWCCFGVEDPNAHQALNIAVEVNPSHTGTDGRVAGAFAWGPGGSVHLCHNGRIGGGRPGVGKKAFFAHYHGDLAKMAHRGQLVDVANLGPIDSPDLASRLAWFAEEVARIKDLIVQGPAPANVAPAFAPEFSGGRNPYTVRATIEAQADHGLVVDSLEQSVDGLGHVGHNDRARDLFVLDEHGALAFLFEVKTDVSTTSIYTAVGQLLLNRGIGMDAVRLVLVVPGTPAEPTCDALRSIGIEILPYHWRKRKPVISESKLTELMRCT